jgi:hypothetical protein
MNVIRQTEGTTQFRVLEIFWESQVTSKVWLIKTLLDKLKIHKNETWKLEGTVYVMGGWYGLMAQLLMDTFPKIKIISIDADSNCEFFGVWLSQPDNDRIQFKTQNMLDIIEYPNASLIINTSAEHMTQEEYEKWYSNLPENVTIVIQSNNLFGCDNHIRCSNDLLEFGNMNLIKSNEKK